MYVNLMMWLSWDVEKWRSHLINSFCISICMASVVWWNFLKQSLPLCLENKSHRLHLFGSRLNSVHRCWWCLRLLVFHWQKSIWKSRVSSLAVGSRVEAQWPEKTRLSSRAMSKTNCSTCWLKNGHRFFVRFYQPFPPNAENNFPPAPSPHPTPFAQRHLWGKVWHLFIYWFASFRLNWNAADYLFISSMLCG